MEKLKRYIVLIIGLFINSLGVAVITKATLGTSPISAIPYVLSLSYNLSLGNFTIIFSLALILLQLLLLGKNFKLEHLLQIPVSIVFGYFIDLCMYFLFFIKPTNYLSSFIFLIVGCVILGIGVYLEMLSDVVMLPGESFVRAVVFRLHSEFGLTKIIFDISISTIALIISLILSKKIDGVREGTIVAAILVGLIARVINKLLPGLEQKLFTNNSNKENISQKI